MYLLFEEGSDIKVATLLTQQGESSHAELPNGKRTKIKNRHLLLQFAQPDAAQFLQHAQSLAQGIDLSFVWECAPLEEFHFADLAQEYFGGQVTLEQQAALALALHNAPIYFRRKGSGRFQRAPEEQLQAALAALERKKALLQLQHEYETMLKGMQLPAAFCGKELSLLIKPDKNSIEFKALDAAARATNMSPMQLLVKVGGISSPLALHENLFLAQYFSHGRDFPIVTLPKPTYDLPLASVSAFSIDDAETTEIDDAFSVTAVAPGIWQIGIHIAAPGLGITRGDALDNIARTRLSTVYCPGDKITMLPEDVINIFTLKEGHTCPALSLYCVVDESSWEIQRSETRIENVFIEHNLRLNQLDEVITEANLCDATVEIPCKTAFKVLWPFVNHLYDQRQKVRLAHGLKPETSGRCDYSYYLEKSANNDVKVNIVPRARGTPLDRIVAELMILANSTWGKLLADTAIPGIYRVQRGWGATRTRMQTHPAPHEGLGVAQYAWSTSPLRRYADLVNQWQIMGVVQHGITAKMAVPFPPKDIELAVIAADFDATYTEYARHQQQMERYWCLRWLQQEHRLQVSAMFVKENIVRLNEIPLTITLPTNAQHPAMCRGDSVLLEITHIDEVALTAEVRLVKTISQAEVSETCQNDEPQ